MSIIFYTDSDYYSGAEKVLLAVWAGVALKEKTLILNPALRSQISHSPDKNRPIDWSASRSKLAFWHFWAYRRLIGRAGATVCVVNMQTPYANTWFLLAARSMDQKIVTIWHFPQEQREITGPLRAVKRLAYQLAIRLSNKIVTVSDWHRRVLVTEFGVPKDKTETIHNGIVDPGVPAQSPPHRPLRFLTIGTLEERKGQRWLVETLATVPGDWHLTLVGDGPDRALIGATIQRLGLREKVTLAGYQPVVEAFYRDHDLLLHPALAENLSLVIIEALAHGRPVIANAVGGNGELVRDGQNGSLLPPLDGPAWRSALVKILAQPILMEAFGAAARTSFLASFTQPTMIDRYQKLLEDVAH